MAVRRDGLLRLKRLFRQGLLESVIAKAAVRQMRAALEVMKRFVYLESGPSMRWSSSSLDTIVSWVVGDWEVISKHTTTTPLL